MNHGVNCCVATAAPDREIGILEIGHTIHAGYGLHGGFRVQVADFARRPRRVISAESLGVGLLVLPQITVWVWVGGVRFNRGEIERREKMT